MLARENHMETTTDFLFARPSALEGIGRILDFAGSYNQYNTSPTPEEADARAIRSDFEAVGRDLRAACEQFQKSSDDRRSK